MRTTSIVEADQTRFASPHQRHVNYHDREGRCCVDPHPGLNQSGVRRPVRVSIPLLVGKPTA